MNDLVTGAQKDMPDDAKKVFEGEIFNIWQWDQELYDGSNAIFERLERENTTHAIGVLPNGKILLVEDEQPHREPVLTPAGGRIEKGESPEEGIRREFLEETGYEIGDLKLWHTYDPSDKMDWTVYSFIARDLKKTGEVKLDPGEKVSILEFSFEEFLQLGLNPKMRDLVIRIILLEALLDQKKKDDLYKLLYGG